MIKKKLLIIKLLIFNLLVGCLPINESPIDPNSSMSNLLLWLRLQNPSSIRPALGELDTSFGENGVRFTEFPGFDSIGYQLAVDSQNRIYQVGSNGPVLSERDLVLVRFLQDGNTDTSFANESVYTLIIGSNISGLSVVVHPENDIFLSGNLNPPRIIRLTPEGQPRSGFGSSGIFTLDSGLRPNAMKVSPSGFVYTGGGTSADDSYISKHHPSSGIYVGEFGTSGIFDSIISSTFLNINEDFHINPDESTTICGYYDEIGGFGDYRSYLLKINASGTLDTGFGAGGIAIPNLFSGFGGASICKSLAIDQSSGIYFTGTSNSDGFVGKLNPNGSDNTGFAQNGLLVFPREGSENYYLNKILIQPDGNVLVGGYVGPGTTTRIFLARIRPDGSMDATFGQDGIFELNLGVSDTMEDMYLLPSGRILISGSSGVVPNRKMYLARIR